MRHERFSSSLITAAEPLAGSARRAVWASLLPSRRTELTRAALSFAALLADAGAVIAAGALVELAYASVAFGSAELLRVNLEVAFLVALVVTTTNLLRDQYAVEAYLSFARHPGQVARLWVASLLVALGLGFATKTTADYSRVLGVAFLATGLPLLLLARLLVVALVRRVSAVEASSIRRVFLIGYERDLQAFEAKRDLGDLGCRVVGAATLREPRPEAGEAALAAQLEEDVALAVSTVRFLRPDDVFILMPWSQTGALEVCVDAFVSVPAALHLRPEVMERFHDIRVARVGRLVGLNVARRPLTLVDVVLKRAFDLALASLALVMLMPLLLLAAAAIRLDSRGPALFRQQRYGFNQQPFQVYKFRSMTAEPERGFRQASRGDARITRVGRFLRRWNIDELPQLLNVLKGDMSLVGPRPHALAHDRAFERRIALYARRHNVRPGITGWAAVNGCRGETATDEAMRRRVELDLHYIDNWSLWLDLKILVLTVVSPKAYRNAY